MLEYLAIPAWQTPPTSLDAWVASLTEASGSPVVVTREGSSVAWLDLGPVRVRGYVQMENGQAAAINFELHALDPEPATRVLEAAAAAVGWELHEDDEDDRRLGDARR
jgi:hypothetical protein